MGIFCERCQTNVILEQDQSSCSNCGGTLIEPRTKPAAKKPAAKK